MNERKQKRILYLSLANALSEHDEKKLDHEVETGGSDCEVCQKTKKLRNQIDELEGKKTSNKIPDNKTDMPI